MIRKGSLVSFTGSSRVIPAGKKLMVHDVKDRDVIVWVLGTTGKWMKRTVRIEDVEEVVE